MKAESNSLLERIIICVKEYRARQERITLEYQRAYSSCFEGSDEEVRIKLARWDEVHRITRQSDSYARHGGLF